MNNESNIAPINEELNVVEYEIEDIKKKIYTIRGKQVMLDSDVAEFYHYTTKNLNKSMKRNIERFPEDFCFQLTKREFDQMWFQNGTTFEKTNVKYRSEKYLPYAYTEHGITMLAGLLKSHQAISTSIKIVNSFIQMRKFIVENGQIFERLTNVEYKLLEHDRKFDEIFNQFAQQEDIKQKIFFEGQIYDAYSLIIDIIKKANSKITIIDNYIDDSILKMLAKKNKDVDNIKNIENK